MGQCLKCGSKAEDGSAFCNTCLEVMEQYPVKPGTVIHLPRRQPRPEETANADFEEPNHAEQLAHQRSLIKWLTGVVAVLSFLLVFTAVLLIHTLEKDQPLPMIGRNYTTSTSAELP